MFAGGRPVSGRSVQHGPCLLGLPDMSYKPQNGSFITVTNGAGANAPSERRSFYFGGFCNDSVAT